MNAPLKRVDPDAEPTAPVLPSETEAEPTATEPQMTTEAEVKPKGRRRLLMFSVPVLLALAGGYVWLTGGRYVTTDNAYVHQPMVSISPDVSGRISEVDVIENQLVQAGMPLFRLDPEPLSIALAEAEAALASAQLSVAQLRAAYDTAQAKLAATLHIKDVRDREFDRQKELASRGISSSASLDESTMAVYTSENDVSLARAAVESAAAALGGDPAIKTDDFPAVRTALAKRAAAKRNLSKAEVLAPVTGIISQIESLNVGQYVTPAATVASIVKTGETWIEANYKETQLETLKIGQPVEVDIDAYPGVKLDGIVESISSATGSQFSLIPAQNATGNWVKVVQRLSIRIGVTPDPAHPLRDGMSTSVSIDTGLSRLDKLK
ncbi:HlyD family secretion protein [Roseobacter sp. N2S]|uniref:HlyD family secretion protein n=1 Tax=Roseobacter sp. N2S TaxID=2663844 RepID=UPI0028592509|nr:HlyD family secretion protein [Roseobacter sp. N2S]MDR6265816.1 membrane fusion protein (multidrug efflux system) [Roseobacter sp. N2S]